MAILYEHNDEDDDVLRIDSNVAGLGRSGFEINDDVVLLPAGRDELTRLIDVLTGIRDGVTKCSTCGAELQGRDADDGPAGG